MDHEQGREILESRPLTMATGKSLDVICLGRAAVDLYGEQMGGRLEDMQSFAKYLGGSSANLAAGLARLGTRSSMLTRVGNEHMGRFVREALAREGVDVSHVVTDPSRLTGLVILGIAGRDSFPHIFYRQDCADLAIEATDFDEDYIGSARALAITGTHLSTAQSYEAVRTAVSYAKAQSTRVILDIDYRPVLWGLTSAGDGEERFIESREVTDRIATILADCHLLVGTEEEINIAGGSTDTLQSLRQIREKTGATIVLKRGPLGCAIFDGDIPETIDAGISVRGVEVEVLNVVGAGDAFLSGFLDAWLREESWPACAASGNTCGALVVSRHGCTPAMPTRAELDNYMSRAGQVPRPDKDAKISYLHAATTRRQVALPLMILAFDHRRQLEDIAPSLDQTGQRISRFKDLVAMAAEQVALQRGGTANLGVIVDERYGAEVLDRLSAQQWWIGRPVEIPGSRPVNFDPQNNLGLPLLRWPATHVVKCLIFYHPDDDLSLRLEQEQRVLELSNDCKALGRELLLEVICSSTGAACDENTTANVMRRFYNLGALPAWWKLESQSIAGWQVIAELVSEYDPHCKGVLLLGLDAPESELRASFRAASQFPICKGFAVGRSIFGEPARRWFNGECDDETVVRDVARNYQSIIQLWEEATATSTDRRMQERS